MQKLYFTLCLGLNSLYISNLMCAAAATKSDLPPAYSEVCETAEDQKALYDAMVVRGNPDKAAELIAKNPLLLNTKYPDGTVPLLVRFAKKSIRGEALIQVISPYINSNIINTTDVEGNTALIVSDCEPFAALLLEKRADVHHRNNHGNSALDLAMKDNFYTKALTLFDAGARLSQDHIHNLRSKQSLSYTEELILELHNKEKE